MKNKRVYLFLLLSSILACLAFNNVSRKKDNNSPIGLVAKPSWKMGVGLYSFNHHSFKVALNMADSCGVQYVEGFSFHQLGEEFGNRTIDNINREDIALMKAMLSKKHLAMTSMYAGGADNVAGWKKYFEIGRQLNVKYLVSEPSKKQWDMIDSLAGIYHIKIAIHDHERPSPYWHPDSVLAAVKGHPNIGACADIGHWARSGLNPAECLQKLQGHIWGLHLKDIDQLHNDVVPGTGIIDFKAVAKELKRQHFNGYIQVECEHKMDNNMEEVKKAIQYFNAVAEDN
jgi:sugar phosphate isomerase/epimerase